jgi:hypothetical protein
MEWVFLRIEAFIKNELVLAGILAIISQLVEISLLGSVGPSISLVEQTSS